MFCSLLAMSMFMTLAASQDTPGLTVTAVVDLKNVVDLETKALVVPPLEIKDAAKSYPALMDGENADVKAGLRGTETSSGVLLKAVKCVKPSTGVDGWVNDMVGGLAAVAIATAGAGACVGTAGAACAVIAAGAGASMGVITQTAVDNGVLASIGKVFPGSDDDLYITMDGTKVWPKGKDHDIGSQETVHPNIFRNGRPTICLMERDSGWWSSDDNMGCADTHRLKPGHVSLIIVSKEEGSSYIVELQIPGERTNRNREVSGYNRVSPGCVSGHNIILFKHLTLQACGVKCNENSGCRGFEYYKNHFGSGRGYKPNDCQLQSGTNTDGCNGVHYNLDMYIKE